MLGFFAVAAGDEGQAEAHCKGKENQRSHGHALLRCARRCARAEKAFFDAEPLRVEYVGPLRAGLLKVSAVKRSCRPAGVLRRSAPPSVRNPGRSLGKLPLNRAAVSGVHSAGNATSGESAPFRGADIRSRSLRNTATFQSYNAPNQPAGPAAGAASPQHKRIGEQTAPERNPGADPIKRGSNSLLKSIFQGKKQETGQEETKKLLWRISSYFR